MNSYLTGINQYPRTRSKMHNTIVHWQDRASCYGIHMPPDAIFFVQDNDDDSSKGKTHANTVQREPQDLSKVK